MSKLSINVIVYSQKETKYIPFLFDSLAKQTFQDWEMIIVDNASDGDVLFVAETEIKKLGKPYRILRQSANIGFAAGHNAAYKETKTPFVLLLNPDMYLLPDVLEKMVKFLEDHPQTATVSARLMRWDFERVSAMTGGETLLKQAEAGFTSDIDAIGIRLFRNRRAVEWLTLERWAKDSDNPEIRKMYEKKILEVFGVSGAFPMYRKTLIDTVLLPDEHLFDPTYHSYKEDLDLAYRLRNAGFTSYILLNAVAYHDRTGAGPKKMNDWAAIKNKKVQSAFVRYHSYKNHLRTLYKNEYWQNVLLDLPFIAWYELKKGIFLLLIDPKVVLRGWKEILQHVSYTKKAHRTIVKGRKMYWKGIRRWF